MNSHWLFKKEVKGRRIGTNFARREAGGGAGGLEGFGTGGGTSSGSLVESSSGVLLWSSILRKFLPQQLKFILVFLERDIAWSKSLLVDRQERT